MSLPLQALKRPAYDIAAADLEQAAGLPGSEDLDAARCLRWVDDAADLVRSKTEQHLFQFKQRPEEYDHSEAVFRMMWLVSVLQRDLGVHYHQETIDLDDHCFFADAGNLFIHGIIQGKGGTCSSMPVLFAAVGRRLGYPLKLVPCKQHLFIRWEGPDGERFNIESTARGYVSHPDEEYLRWPAPATPEEVKRYKWLQAETQEEEMAEFLCRRGRVWMEHGRYGDAAFEYLRAFFQVPGLEATLNSMHHAVTVWGKHMRSQIGWGFPGLVVCNQPIRHRALPENLQAEINYLNALEIMLNNPVHKKLWWDPLRRDPTRRPPGMPEWIQVTYPATPGDPLYFEPCQPPRDDSRLSPFD
ncbi:MAG: hypothetical protein HYS12_17950 [Planctomycetes bacterium]|nr:hypothetical protein [Planctomycetota bacterium]